VPFAVLGVAAILVLVLVGVRVVRAANRQKRALLVRMRGEPVTILYSATRGLIRPIEGVVGELQRDRVVVTAGGEDYSVYINEIRDIVHEHDHLGPW
jgi:hypothetical protein